MQYTSKEVYEYISKQTKDPIVEWKTCRISGTEFPIYQSDMDFYAKISPSFAGLKFQIPAPTLCPEERQRRRLSFRNERKLYKRKCDFSGRDIISIYSPDKPYKLYDQKIRWSDAWDPMSYGQEFDFGKTFTEQFEELMKEVPRRGLINTSSVENSPYTNFTDSSKNIYMCSDVWLSEDVYYSHTLKYLHDCCDNLDLKHSYHCYDVAFSSYIRNSKHIYFSNNCNDCIYIKYGNQLSNCAFCVGLHQKEYSIFNKFVGKENYNRELLEATIQLTNSMCKLQKLSDDYIYANRILNSENVIGNNIENCSDLQFCFEIDNATRSKYVFVGYGMDMCMDTSVHNIECFLDYEAISGGKLHHSAFNMCGWGGSYIFYTQECIDCNYLFGCIGLRNKSYCIFNKQYTKEEYEKTVVKIIGHMQETGEWGEFFHPSLSPFGYNETVANEYFPLSAQQILPKATQEIGGLRSSTRREQEHQVNFGSFGYHRLDYSSDPKIPAGANVVTLKEEQYQERLELTKSDEVLKQVIICEASGRPFMIQRAELAFYRKHNLPIPSKHPDIRHEERMKLRPGRTLFLRNCDCCGDEVLSVYEVTSNRNKVTGTNHTPTTVNSGCLLPDPCCQKVYCETCYQKEIYS